MTIDYKKIMAVIGIDVIAITVLYFIYGFAIGGRPEFFSNVPYTIFSIISVSVISIFTFFFIRKRAVGKKLPPYLLVGIMFAVYWVSFGIYNFGNEVLSTEASIKYESTVTDVKIEGGRRSYYEIRFTDQNGNEVSVSSEYNSPAINATVQVEEIPGAFGYSEYYVTFEVVESKV